MYKRQVFTELTGIRIYGGFYRLDIFLFYMLSGYYMNNKVNVISLSRKKAVGLVSVNIIIIFCACGVTILHFFRTGVYDQSCLDTVSYTHLD